MFDFECMNVEKELNLYCLSFDNKILSETHLCKEGWPIKFYGLNQGSKFPSLKIPVGFKYLSLSYKIGTFCNRAWLIQVYFESWLVLFG